MEIRVCPECQKAFYALPENYVACPHCGFVLYDRRYRKRLERELSSTFTIGGKKRQAVVRDYSDTGLRISYKGAPLPVDTELKLDVDDLNLHRAGKSVWTKAGASSTKVTGLMLI